MELFTIWLSTFSALFAVIDPFGSVPIFITLTKGSSREERRHILRKACLTSFGALCGFTVLGETLLRLFGISIPALQISGGAILVVIAFQMLQLNSMTKLSDEEENTATLKEDISIVPLAIPLLAGPASFTTLIIFGAKLKGVEDYLMLMSAIVANLAIAYWVLSSASRFMSLFGMIGLNIFTRLMGLLLSAMAIQSIINGYLAIR